jgi:hypothetical protein
MPGETISEAIKRHLAHQGGYEKTFHKNMIRSWKTGSAKNLCQPVFSLQILT